MSLYFKYFKTHFKKELEYKASFIMSFIAQIFTFFGYYFSVICIFDKFNSIKGFTIYEVLLTLSIIEIGHSFCEMFFRGVDKFDSLIIKGEFDRILLRPRNMILQVFCEEVEFVKLSKLIQAAILLTISVINIDVIWTKEKILTLIFMIISSIVMFLGIFIISAAYCFLTVKGLEVRNLLTDGSKHMAKYPIGIFKKGFITFFTFIIPFGFVNYYPLLFLVGKETNKIYVFSPLITILFLIPSVLLFYKGSKRYTSVGS